MKKLFVYIRLHYVFLILLITLVNTPYYLNIKLNFNIPYLTYFFLILLFSIKILVIKSNASSKKILKKAQASLGKNSSKQQIINRGIDIQNGYDFCLALSALGIIFIAIFTGGFK